MRQKFDESLAERLAELKRNDQPWRSTTAKVDVPCEFHVFLPKAGIIMAPSTGTLQTFIWDPITDRPLGRESFMVPNWKKGEPFQLLNVEGKKTLFLVGEVQRMGLETSSEPLDWMMSKGITEFQSVCGQGFMTFDPRDCFIDGVDHSFGRMILEPDLPVSGLSLFTSVSNGDMDLWRHGVVALSMKAGRRGDRKNLEALARAGLVQKYQMGLATVFSERKLERGRMNDRGARNGLMAVFPGL